MQKKIFLIWLLVAILLLTSVVYDANEKRKESIVKDDEITSKTDTSKEEIQVIVLDENGNHEKEITAICSLVTCDDESEKYFEELHIVFRNDSSLTLEEILEQQKEQARQEKEPMENEYLNVSLKDTAYTILQASIFKMNGSKIKFTIKRSYEDEDTNTIVSISDEEWLLTKKKIYELSQGGEIYRVLHYSLPPKGSKVLNYVL
ncbi:MULTISPECIES: hypothetical protein [unclassified Breznakia]|uniref:hypothetical protein n=1 Tax=unclassified Breznakia TaxID=2623764 RepID=UPI00247654F6|nr:MULTISPECIES: hypothetical protein [unclassified Breznakia]MDH6367046.1 cell division protein FtsL [Breznakia sp. PH1-1]MDH6404182.1 cell division protein FtsL [Breznakia sp. PF1-11]MDH6411933.1 cell division protein FtsL [Breznakia sp. PFB1-11]MDH6414170.1 cell division protein FtsL [Breznakia sp. PFB1-14]MDH6418923.1 cell division protein FtsL [Breznakia sp. PFB1-12]